MSENRKGGGEAKIGKVVRVRKRREERMRDKEEKRGGGWKRIGVVRGGVY